MESSLFQSVRYYLADDVKNTVEVKNILKQGGGMREFYLNELVTHVITETPPDPATLPLSDVIIVKADWVVMSDKCGALLPVKAFEPKNDKLFTNVVFCCSKLSCSDMEKLVVLTMFYGGKMQRMLDSSVTHLVTMEASGAKYECAQKHSDVMKVVTPDWVLDSIDAGKRQDESLYHPTCLKLKGSSGGGHHGQPGHASPSLLKCNGDTNGAAAGEKGEEGEIGEKQDTHSPLMGPAGGEQFEAAIDEGQENSIAGQNAVKDEPMSNEPSTGGGGGQTLTEKGGESVSKFTEELLDGLVVVFTDYQDCMDEDTMDKWKQVVEQHGGSVASRYNPKQCTHLLALNKSGSTFTRASSDGKCIASAHWLNDVLTEQKMFPPSNPLHFPTAFKWQLPGAERYSMSLTNYTGVEREMVKDMFRITGVSFTGHLSRENTHLICKRPEGKKYEKALEWGIQVVNATFLADIIHNGQVPAVLFSRHTKLGEPDEFTPCSCFEATRLLKPWEKFMSDYSERHPNLIDQAATEAALGSMAPSSPAESAKRSRSTSVEAPSTQAKKPKVEDESTDNSGNVQMTVLFTGISQSVVKNLKQIILRFGGKLTDIGRECTHIVSPRVTRTVKFLSGISVCRHIVTPDWVEECGRAGRLVNEKNYVLRDHDAEEMFDMNVAASLSRARNRKLLKGLCFYSTENVQPSFAHLKEIIECAGGVLWTQAELKNNSLDSLNKGRFFVISAPEDIAAGLCSDFFKHDIPIYNAELVLTGVLRQMLDLNTFRNQLVAPS